MFRLASLKALTSCHSRHPLEADVSGIRQLVRLRTSRSDKHKHLKFLLKIGIISTVKNPFRMRKRRISGSAFEIVIEDGLLDQ